MKSYGYEKIYTKKDLPGIDRVVIGTKLWYNDKLTEYENNWRGEYINA